MKMTRGSSPYKAPGMRKMAEGGSVDKPKRKVVTTKGKEITGKRADKIRKAAAEGKSEVRTGLFGLGKRYKIKDAGGKKAAPSTPKSKGGGGGGGGNRATTPKTSLRPKSRPSRATTTEAEQKETTKRKTQGAKQYSGRGTASGYKPRGTTEAEQKETTKRKTQGAKRYSGRGGTSGGKPVQTKTYSGRGNTVPARDVKAQTKTPKQPKAPKPSSSGTPAKPKKDSAVGREKYPQTRRPELGKKPDLGVTAQTSGTPPKPKPQELSYRQAMVDYRQRLTQWEKKGRKGPKPKQPKMSDFKRG